MATVSLIWAHIRLHNLSYHVPWKHKFQAQKLEHLFQGINFKICHMFDSQSITSSNMSKNKSNLTWWWNWANFHLGLGMIYLCLPGPGCGFVFFIGFFHSFCSLFLVGVVRLCSHSHKRRGFQFHPSKESKWLTLFKNKAGKKIHICPPLYNSQPIHI